MACIQYPRKERGGVNPGSWEQPTIYKDPPKEIFTRKKERVEEGDITHNIRADSTRYGDAINNYAKSQNMMVAVDYQNRNPHTTTMNFGSASNPYKVNKSFRPPIYRQEDLLPLSRQKRETVGGRSNPGSSITRDDFFAENRMDSHEVQFSTHQQHSYHAEQTNIAHEQGVYSDNFQRKDMMNDKYITQNVLSHLKGMESVELQKMFQYEQTPNGIVMTPLSVEAFAALSGLNDYEAQRVLGNEGSFLHDELVQYGQQVNSVGRKDYEAHRNLDNESSHLREELLRYGQQSNVLGAKDYEAHRNLSNESSHLREELLRYGQQSNVLGAKDYEAHRNLDNESSHLREELLRYGQGTNVKGVSKQEYLEVHKEKMKDVLLKNMKSSVHIVIQKSGGHDEYLISGSVQDKIGIVVSSAKGQPVSLQRDNGETIKLKDYTWKFVKSATGTDTFVIQADMPDMELDRKATLYVAQSNMNHNIHVPIMNNVELKTERINTAATTNASIPENIHNADRVASDVTVRKAEKETNYTDWMVQSVQPTMDRVDVSNVRLGNKQRNQQRIVHEMEGRFD